MRNTIKKLLLILLTLFLLLLSCCQKKNISKAQDEFQALTEYMFRESVNSDTLSLNYSLADPRKYNITPTIPTLGSYSIANMKSSYEKSQAYLEQLSSLSYEDLSQEDRLTYDILTNHLKEDDLFYHYLYYNECIRPTTGIQAQLPILLAEYNFYTKEDIVTYLKLLPCIQEYFDSIIEFEREKSKQGLFMSDYLADQVISQCKSFVQEADNNYLISYFNHKIDAYPSLTKKERDLFKLQNEQAIKEFVLPAYQSLIDGLTSLKGTGKNAKGLYYLPDGAKYYALLANSITGSGRSIREMISLLDQTITGCYQKASSIVSSDSKFLEKYVAFQSFPLTEPSKILDDLKEQISKDYPELPDVKCDIKYVDPCLSDYLSPAMYLVPAMDNYENNHIYINGNDRDTLAYIYTTVAHEGYPGHLYQCVYYRSTNPNPIRHTLNFPGYDEGWATYVELASYGYSGIDHNLAEFFALNNLAVLCIYARADIGIHYEGWNIEDTKEYLANYMEDEVVQTSIYYTLLKDPGAYLPYAIGCLEFLSLKQEAAEALGDQFVLKDFHKFLLDLGPCQFYVLEKYLDAWIHSINGRPIASEDDLTLLR